MSAKQRLVIIGNGMAAARAIEEVLERAGADRFQISVFSEESCPSYDRLRVASVMSGALAVDHIFHRTRGWYKRHGVRVHWGEQAVVVSRRTRVVYGSAGSEERYDTLVFATGSSPHIPPIKNLFRPDGTRVPGVCEFRTLADCVRIMALLNGARRVAIMGGGLLGLEASRGLAPHRCRLDLLHRGDRLLSDGLDDAAALLLLQRVREMGIQVHLKRSVSALAGNERVTGLVLDDGSVMPCDLVVVATGLIPNTWLAYQCGLTVERGIAVDAQMRCLEDRSIYALGECAQPRGKTFGLAAAIRQQAKLLAEHLTGGAPSTGLASTTKRERHANDRARPIELAR